MIMIPCNVHTALPVKCNFLKVFATECLLTILSVLLQFKNPSKWYRFNRRIVRGKNFKMIASVVYPVFMTKSCEQFLVIFVYTYKIPRNLRNAATQMIVHHTDNFTPI